MKQNKPQVTCIIGGQYGSEGKGVICGYLGSEFDVAVRVGAPNAGHTLKIGQNKWKMRQIPVAGLVNPDMILCIGPAGLINEEVLEQEMEMIPNCTERLFIDRNAGILEKRHIEEEEEEKKFESIGSTCEGVGAALKDKISRNRKFKTAKDIKWLKPYITDVAEYLNNMSSKKKIMIEGTQGFALSLNHGPYPFCTSRDVLASSLLSDVGIAPSLCTDVIMVVRTYPIRVAGNSGPMCGKELTWKEVTERSGYPNALEEKTTVTKRVRRVCEFDIDLVKRACLLNRPTQLAVTFADYITHEDFGKTKYADLTDKTKGWIKELERETDTPVTLIKTGIEFDQIIDRRKNRQSKEKQLEFPFGKNGTDIYDEGKNI